MVVPDNLRSGVHKACRYDPELNPSYQQLAEHYQVVILPARPYKPKDKAKADVGVQIVERWILARLRRHRFFTLAALNQCIRSLLEELNSRPFQRLPGTRKAAFGALDMPALSVAFEDVLVEELQPVAIDFDRGPGVGADQRLEVVFELLLRECQSGRQSTRLPGVRPGRRHRWWRAFSLGA